MQLSISAATSDYPDSSEPGHIEVLDVKLLKHLQVWTQDRGVEGNLDPEVRCGALHSSESLSFSQSLSVFGAVAETDFNCCQVIKLLPLSPAVRCEATLTSAGYKQNCTVGVKGQRPAVNSVSLNRL